MNRHAVCGCLPREVEEKAELDRVKEIMRQIYKGLNNIAESTPNRNGKRTNDDYLIDITIKESGAREKKRQRC